MSVTKRKQAKNLQRLAARLPMANLAGAALVWFGASQGAAMGDRFDGTIPWGHMLVGGLVGFGLFAVGHKYLQQVEKKLKLKINELTRKIESKIDEEQGSNNRLLDAYQLEYHGGHPGWVLKGKVEYGTLDIHEKNLLFRNQHNRAKLQLARIRRVTIEPLKLLRAKRLTTLVLPKPATHKNALLKAILEFVQSKQRWLVIDYLDDLGEKHLVAFYPSLGSARAAKAVKTAIDEVHRKIPKEKRVAASPTADLGPSARQQVSTAALAAAEAASRRVGAVEATATVPAPSAPPVVERYQVALVGAGDTAEARAAIVTQMAGRFSIPEEKLALALARLPFVMKRNLSYEQARQLVSILEGIGATARAEAMPVTASLHG